MRVTRTLILGLILSLLAGCSSIRVKSDWDPEADFSSLHSWAWAPEPHKKQGDPLRDDDTIFADRVRRSVTRELEAKGYRFVENAEPDFWVAFFLVVEDKLAVTTINNHYGYGPGGGPVYGYHGGWGYGPGGFGSQTVVDQYQEGTLVIDLSRSEHTQLVWRGAGSARLAREYTPEKAEAKLGEAVSEILKRFPPPAKKQKE